MHGRACTHLDHGMGEHLVGLTKHEVLPFFLGAGKMKSQANGGRADSHDEIES